MNDSVRAVVSVSLWALTTGSARLIHDWPRSGSIVAFGGA
jgi:hypothetical protein